MCAYYTHVQCRPHLLYDRIIKPNLAQQFYILHLCQTITTEGSLADPVSRKR